jgi:Co/Zn/Cd efflux system component
MHVVADAFTSVLAIGALLAGRFLGWGWLDAVSGIVGGLVILKWGASLSRSAAFELLDVMPSSTLEDEIRATLESLDDVRVSDLHVWSLGGGARSCVATLVTATPRDPRSYRAELARFALAHLTIEVQRCEVDHPGVLPSATSASAPGAAL